MEQAQRIIGQTSGIFAELAGFRRQVESRGTMVIDLSIGSPDLPPAPHIIEALHRAVDKLDNYRYPIAGLPVLHQAVADWYGRRFNVKLDSNTEVLELMGTQDGLAHLALAYINPGDLALVPDPCYPIYTYGIKLAGGMIHSMPLLAENHFLPDLQAIPGEVANKAKLMWLNYPSNPVAAVADKEFFSQVVDFAHTNKILVCHDVAYAQLAYEGFKPMSFLEVPGAKDVGIEFYSVSKTYNMAGCRLGFAVGNAEVLSALGRLKSNIDYGVFAAVQEAGVAALEGPQDCVETMAQIYQERRDVLVDGLLDIGWDIPKPQASMFLWAPLPAGYTSSREFALKMLDRAGVLFVPGLAFGEQGEGYVRIALVQDKALLAEVVERISRAL